MAAPLGNQNARKSRMFEQALVRAIKQRDLKEGEGETLRKVAEALLDRAIAQDVTAIKETRDTLDGKPTQTIAGDQDNPIRTVGRIELAPLLGNGTGPASA
jgi:hypothetical protein